MFTPAPQNILIVDDSNANIMFLCNALEGYNCMCANDGNSAIQIADGDTKPDLILLDIVMTGMDGYEVCKILKKNNDTKDIPVIFITANKDADSLVKGFGVGAVDFITKPFNIEELKVRVSTQLKYKKTLDDNNRYLKSIEEIYDTITDSLYYAQRIQNATLPHDSYLEKMMEEYFVIYRPRDIVSGDFYWVNKTQNKLLLVAADCTGHGVPGALMSMMSLAFVKEIITLENILQPHDILNKLRSTIISTFYSSDTEEISDGLDAAIVLIDLENNYLHFSGANSPLYIIRSNELIEFKGNRMPVGSYPMQNPFSSVKVNIKEGDCIYLFSDGYADQFGGAENRKMMHHNFRDTLLKYNRKPMKQQKELLIDYFYTWMGYNDQVDDILVLGYRYKKEVNQE